MATNIDRTKIKVFNVQLLIEQLETVSLQVSVQWPGFKGDSPGRMVNDPASPFNGQMKIEFKSDLTPQQIIDVDTALDSHDSTVNTVEEVSVTQDKADLQELKTLYQNRATWTNADSKRALVLTIRIIGRFLRR